MYNLAERICTANSFAVIIAKLLFSMAMIMEKLRERGIPDERIVSYRFDSMEYDDMTSKQMYAELKGRISPDEKTYFFLDEVPDIDGWEKVVNSLAADFDVDIYVTGSNSRMMSSEICISRTASLTAFVMRNIRSQTS